MSDYFPDEWVLVLIKPEPTIDNPEPKPFYKVFGSWRGGFVDSDHWRLNSGIVRHEEDETHFRFYGNSGSCYQCRKRAYGIRSPYNSGVLLNYKEAYPESFFIMEEMPVVNELEW
jgi:hypothetical protein